MSSYPPPVRNYAIYDSVAFQVDDENALTISNANRSLLKYPNAQDGESFQAVNITSGTIDMGNNNITNMDNISSNLTDKTSNIVTQEQIYLEIDPSANWVKQNGYLSLSKNDVPSLIGTDYDLNTWTSRTSALDNFWTGMAYSPELNRIVCVSGFGGTANRVQYSNDGGITWISTPASNNTITWKSVAWSPTASGGIFAAVSDNNPRYMWSNDGITWTTGSGPIGEAVRVIWVEELKLFVASYNISNSGQRVSTSTDGKTWTHQGPTTFNYQISCLAWSPDKCLIVGLCDFFLNNFFIYSRDGINWFQGTIPATGWKAVTYSRQLERFVAVGGSNVMYSDNGINWTLVTSPAGTATLNGVCWSDDYNLFVACDAQTTSTQRIIVSADGITWTRKNTPVNQATAIIYVKEWGHFVVCCDSGTGNRIFTSNLKEQIPTSLNVFNSSYNNVNESNQWELTLSSTGWYDRVNTTPNPFFVLSGPTSLVFTGTATSTNNHLVVIIEGTTYKIKLWQ